MHASQCKWRVEVAASGCGADMPQYTKACTVLLQYWARVGSLVFEQMLDVHAVTHGSGTERELTNEYER